MKRILERTKKEDRLLQLTTVPSMSIQMAEMFNTLDLKELFRMHPWRLIRLINTSKEMSVVVSLKEKEEKYFWYHICKFSFPDACISLQEKQQISPLIDACSVLFMTSSTESEMSRGFAFNQMDRTFTDADTLDRCLRDSDYARDILICFKALCPFGVPPSQYYFVSHMVLREKARLFAEIIGGINDNDTLEQRLLKWVHSTVRQYSLHVFENDRQYVTLNQSMLYIGIKRSGGLPPKIGITSLGDGSTEIQKSGKTFSQYPTSGDIIKGFPTGIYSFVTLYNDITSRLWDYISRTDSADLQKLIVPLTKLRQSVIECACLYELPEGLDVHSLFRVKEGSRPELNTIDMVAIDRLKEERVAKYGTVDPLVYEMIVLDDISMKDLTNNDGWREIIKNQINWVKKYRGPENIEYTNISSHVCANCPNTNLGSLHLEPIEPYNLFCHNECRQEYYNKK